MLRVLGLRFHHCAPFSAIQAMTAARGQAVILSESFTGRTNEPFADFRQIVAEESGKSCFNSGNRMYAESVCWQLDFVFNEGCKIFP